MMPAKDSLTRKSPEICSHSTRIESLPTGPDGTPRSIIKRPSKDELIATENEIAKLWDDGELPFLVHLCGGNEDQLLEIFDHIKPTDWVFVSHRHHYHALLHGMPKETLVANIKDGRSMFNYFPKFCCSAIVAGTASIAAGVALSIQLRGGSERVHCFVGDAASEHGHFFEAVRFADGRDLPIRFYIENNDSSCGVTQAQRHIKSFAWQSIVTEYHYSPTHPHAGTGRRPNLKWRAS